MRKITGRMAHGPTKTNMPYCKMNGWLNHENERRKTLLATSNNLTLTRLCQYYFVMNLKNLNAAAEDRGAFDCIS